MNTIFKVCDWGRMGYYKTYGIGNITKKIYLIKICVGSNYRIKMLEKKINIIN